MQATSTQELQNVKGVLKSCPINIANQANFKPISALFVDDYVAASLPVTKKESDITTLDYNKDLDLTIIKRYVFKPLNKIDCSDHEFVKRLINNITRVNRYKLESAKQKS